MADGGIDMQNCFDEGCNLARGVVDCIGAMPARFASLNEREFWQGFIAEERQRVREGKRTRADLDRLELRYIHALRASYMEE
jgi:hypothetical protein